MTLKEIASFEPPEEAQDIYDAILREVDLLKREEKITEQTSKIQEEIDIFYTQAKKRYIELQQDGRKLTDDEITVIITAYLEPIEQRNRAISRVREEVFLGRPIVTRNK